jgi:hypothetical protein
MLEARYRMEALLGSTARRLALTGTTGPLAITGSLRDFQVRPASALTISEAPEFADWDAWSVGRSTEVVVPVT